MQEYLYKTAKTAAPIGNIPANTYVAVHYVGNGFYDISTSVLFSDVEYRVHQDLLDRFCL